MQITSTKTNLKKKTNDSRINVIIGEIIDYPQHVRNPYQKPQNTRHSSQNRNVSGIHLDNLNMLGSNKSKGEKIICSRK